MPKDEWTCESISSDGIRGELMQDLMDKKKITRG